MGGAQAPEFPLSLEGERTPRTRRERVLRSGRISVHDGAQAPSPLTPRPTSFPRKREPTLSLRTQRGRGRDNLSVKLDRVVENTAAGNAKIDTLIAVLPKQQGR